MSRVGFCLWVLIGSLLVIGPALSAVPVSAETPAEVVEGANGGGLFIAPGIGAFDEVALVAVVERAQRLGIQMLIVAASDPQPDDAAFALRVRQRADVEVALLFGPEGEIEASVVDEYKNHYPRSLESAKAATTPDEAADLFLTQLTTEPDRSFPDVITTIVRGVVYLLVILLLASIAEHLLRRRRQSRNTPERG
jgi:hypothetical protein